MNTGVTKILNKEKFGWELQLFNGASRWILDVNMMGDGAWTDFAGIA